MLVSCLKCGALVERRDRDRHRSLHTEQARPSASARGYDGAWREIRAVHLRMEPDCRHCGEPATDVDHIVTRREGGSDEHSNLRSLCHSCHSRRTMGDLRAAHTDRPLW